jgi:hypothetical protein
MTLTTEQTILAAARAGHETNRVWCIAHGDDSQPRWEDAEEWQRESSVAGVVTVRQGGGPADQHQGWLNDKIGNGWVYGDVKDSDAKTHPCLVPYDELPEEQKIKDSIYIAVVQAFLEHAPVAERGELVLVDDKVELAARVTY